MKSVPFLPGLVECSLEFAFLMQRMFEPAPESCKRLIGLISLALHSFKLAGKRCEPLITRVSFAPDFVKLVLQSRELLSRRVQLLAVLLRPCGSRSQDHTRSIVMVGGHGMKRCGNSRKESEHAEQEQTEDEERHGSLLRQSPCLFLLVKLGTNAGHGVPEERVLLR